jgi:hypothetical protein
VNTSGLICVILFLLCNLCSSGKADVSKTIEWDKSTLVLVHKGGSYARMIRLRDGDILCCFEHVGKAWIRGSTDNGKTWGEPMEVAKAPSGSASNPELLQLANGWVLLFYNERPDDGVHHFTIQVSVSKDKGRTWKHHSKVYEADVNSHNGCWEPSAIQLPSGEIQLVFANEFPYKDSDEQEITLLRSFDNGRTWSEAKAISFRAGHRDGMPVPCILKDKSIVCAIEDNGLTNMFTPAIIHTTDNWNEPFAGGSSPRRWQAVQKPIDVEWGGAPYIRQMPSGETILSFQSSVGREWPQMVVYVGDENAKNFGGRSVPFTVSKKKGGWWGSLFVKDEHTITAISSCNGGVWAIDGKVVGVGF